MKGNALNLFGWNQSPQDLQIASCVEETLALETAPGKDVAGAPARDLMDRLREVASRLGPEALAARRPVYSRPAKDR